MKKLFAILLFIPLFSAIPAKRASRFTGLTIIKPIIMEYWQQYLANDNNLYAIYQSSNVVQLPLPGGRLVADAAGCFNLGRACATDGSVWQGLQYNSLTAFSTTAGAWWTQITTDSTNATISNAIGMFGYADNYITLRADSSLWFGGTDNAFIFHSSGSVFMRPFKMTTGSQKFRKAIICASGVWAISSDGMTLYNWATGSGTSPTTYTFSGKGTGKVLDVGSADGNAYTNAVVIVIQQTAGSLYGHPYIQGGGWGLWGQTTSQIFASFTDVYSQWSLSSLVREILVNGNTIHFIDSLQNLYGTGFDVQGEVGDGFEFVNRWTYINFPHYGWDSYQENPINGVVQIAVGHKFSHIYSNNYFTDYCDALDVNDSLYVWGRNKNVVLPVGPNGTRTGLLDFNDNPNNSNAQDVLVPTLAHPFNQNILTLNWTAPTISTANQFITTSSTTLTVGGHPALLVNAANSTDTVNYTPSTYQWVVVSKPVGSPTPFFSNAIAQTTTVSSLVTGTYVFGITTVDSNQGTNYTTLTVTVTAPTPTIKITIGSGAINKTNSH
jgi:hypothetical protein